MTLRRLDRYARDLLDKAQALEVPEDLEDRFAAYRDDPVGFARDVLAVDEIPAYQEAVLGDVAEWDRVGWVAGHATGKSYAAALLVAWYLLTRPFSKVIVTSATFERQVGRVVFAKLRTLVARAPVALPLEVFTTRAHVTGFDEWAAEGVPATRPGNFAGFHADRMLVIADEAKGLGRDVFEELHGNLASARNEARMLLCSTAGPATGYFFECFERRAEMWRLHRTPSTESPFAVGYAERMLQECLGPDDPVYRMRVLAEFAEDVEGQLIPLSAIYRAAGREFDDPEVDEAAGVVLGCDVARFGDDRSVVAVRKGRTISELRAWRGADTMTTAERIESLMRLHQAEAQIDAIGLGAGVVDRLRRLTRGAHEVNVAESAPRSDLFANKRAQLGWMLRGRFLDGSVSIPDDPALISELAAIRYQYDTRGRVLLEAKDQAKIRLGRSPDLADAVLLAFAGESLAYGREVSMIDWSGMLQAVGRGRSVRMSDFEIDDDDEYSLRDWW